MREHMIVFYTKLLGMMSRAGELWQIIRKEKHARTTDALLCIHNGKHAADVKKIYPQTYKWSKGYALVKDSAGGFLLVVRPMNVAGFEAFNKDVDNDNIH